jgi:hypothetical protein
VLKAAHHIGNSAAGRRWSVPRIAHVFASVRSFCGVARRRRADVVPIEAVDPSP